jgi:hypothetical protein
LSRLGIILVEIGQAIDERHILVVVIRAVSSDELRALPDTTHAAMAGAQDTAAEPLDSIDHHGRMASTRAVPPDEFADSIVIRDIYNLLLPQEDGGMRSVRPFRRDHIAALVCQTELSLKLLLQLSLDGPEVGDLAQEGPPMDVTQAGKVSA